jgi:hypothetical protein
MTVIYDDSALKLKSEKYSFGFSSQPSVTTVLPIAGGLVQSQSFQSHFTFTVSLFPLAS